MIVTETKGRIPSGLGAGNVLDVKITIKHYFPGFIKSGYMMGNGKRITSGLDTAGGQLMVNVPSYQLPFVQKLHMCVSRSARCTDLNLNENLPKVLLNEKRRQIHDEIKRTQPSEKSRNGLVANVSGVMQISGKNFSILSKSDLIYLPIFNGETALHKVDGGLSYSPCCSFGGGPSSGNRVGERVGFPFLMSRTIL